MLVTPRFVTASIVLRCVFIFSCFTSSGIALGQGTNIFSWNADSTAIIVNGTENTCISLRGGSAIDTNEKHSGTGAIRHTLTDAQQDLGCNPAGSAAQANLYDGGEAYFRWWMKIDSGMNWGEGHRKTKIGRMNRANDKNPLYATINLHYNTLNWQADDTDGSAVNYYLQADFDPSDGSCHSSTLVGNLGADCTEWREYILYVRRNTCSACADGVLMLYINRQLADFEINEKLTGIQPADGVTDFKYAWAGIGGRIFPQICPIGSNCGVGGTIWVDDISTDSVWNSTLGPTPITDAVNVD